jgi:hypothetical protein
MTTYTETLSTFGHLMTVEEFRECVKIGGFIDYDGFGHPVKDEKMSSIVVYPSKVVEIPADATHIMWYNR